MSIMCCVYVPEGIVMAADSRLTRTKQKNANVNNLPINGGAALLIEKTSYTQSDNSQKVLLIKKADVGISFCGNALINGATVADYIRRFEIDKVSDGDTTEIIANKLSEYCKGTDTLFFVGGYDDDIPYVYEVSQASVSRRNIQVRNQEPAPAERLTLKDDKPDDNGTPETLGEHPQPFLEKDSKTSEEPIVRYGATWGGQIIAINKIVNDNPPLNADWGTMPLKDAIDFAEFLIDTTIKYERFCDEIQTCGGDIDILVITKDEAFWKQHKIYNPAK